MELLFASYVGVEVVRVDIVSKSGLSWWIVVMQETLKIPEKMDCINS